MNWKSAREELRYGTLTQIIAALRKECRDLEARLATQTERNRLLSDLLNQDEAVRKKASDEINTRILDDMRKNPGKYVDSSNRG